MKYVSIALLLCAASADGNPDCRRAGHSQGNIQLSLDNRATYGWPHSENPLVDPYTSDTIKGCIYPRNSDLWYLRATMDIGAVKGRDTLVSIGGMELTPDVYPFGAFEAGSIDRGKTYCADWAKSELDLICQYTDTVTGPSSYVPYSWWDQRSHIPIGLRITQRSYAWSGEQIDDFVIIDYELMNISGEHLHGVWVSFEQWNGGAHMSQDNDDEPKDGLTGYIRSVRPDDGCDYVEPINLAYMMDNDGDPTDGSFTSLSPLAAVGIQFLGGSMEYPQVNYNWHAWASGAAQNWGPRRAWTPEDPWRTMHQGYATAYTDEDKYYVMRHREVDYDQLFSAVDYTSDGWMPPYDEPHASGLAVGSNVYSRLSFGPFDLPPGHPANFAIAIVGGDSVHHDPTAFENLMNPQAPQAFYDQLDFSRLIENARWAKRVYDNPGIDTDGDGNRGEFCIHEGDTVWYKGDGVPDFNAGTPPPAPYMRFITQIGKIVIRWNGYYSETYTDNFLGLKDFEGYRVYLGLDERRASLTILSEYDREDYYPYKFTQVAEEPQALFKWMAEDEPVTLDELRERYSAPDFNPDLYSRSRPFEFGGEFFYFDPVAYNRDDLTRPDGIRKVYPDAEKPPDDPALWSEDMLTYDYDEPLPKYYEYEFVVDGLLPTIPYYVAVTAFDFGLGGGRMPAMESNPLNTLQEAPAQTNADTVEAYNMDVIVYPNPYRIDEHYVDEGYENRLHNVISDRARRIHFTNLPKQCIISIYTPDGDLVRKIKHDYPEGGPRAMHETWDLINRNIQAVVTGLYYWVVESDGRTQMGKLVIIK